LSLIILIYKLSLSCVASSQTRDTFAEQIIYISTLLLSRCCNIVAQRANVVPIILTPSGIADSSTVLRGMACRDTRNYFPTLDLDRGILTYCSDDLKLLTRARVQRWLRLKMQYRVLTLMAELR